MRWSIPAFRPVSVRPRRRPVLGGAALVASVIVQPCWLCAGAPQSRAVQNPDPLDIAPWNTYCVARNGQPRPTRSPANSMTVGAIDNASLRGGNTLITPHRPLVIQTV